MDKVYKIYTDGACSGNPGPGAIAYVIIDDTNTIIHEYSQYFPETTNNRMELLSVIFSLQYVKKITLKVTVYSDSTYVTNTINNKWIETWEKQNWKNRKNKDLWKLFIDTTQNMEVNFKWVKGHSDNEYNKRCDFLAKKTILQKH
jgi:ribonuclease HI